MKKFSFPLLLVHFKSLQYTKSRRNRFVVIVVACKPIHMTTRFDVFYDQGCNGEIDPLNRLAFKNSPTATITEAYIH